MTSRARRPRRRRWDYGRFMTNAGKTASTAFTALKIAKHVKDMVNVEYKYFDVTAIIQNALNTGTVVSLNEIPQGDDAIEREGQQVKTVSIQLIVQAQRIAANTNPGNVVRVLLIRDSDNTANAAPAVADVLSNVNAIGPRELTERTRFSILWDKVWTLSLTGTQVGLKKYYKKFREKNIWSSGNTAIARKNAYFLIFLSSETANYPTFSYYSRIRFVDN